MSKASRIILLVLVVLVVIAGHSRVRFDVDVFGLFPPGLREAEGLSRFQHHFSGGDELDITLQAGDAESALAAAEALVRELTNAQGSASRNSALDAEPGASIRWRSPGLQDGEASELVAFFWWNGRPEDLKTLEHGLQPGNSRSRLAEAMEDLSFSLSIEELGGASYDPLGLTDLGKASSLESAGGADAGFASADGTFRLIRVRAPNHNRTYRDTRRWVASVRKTVENWSLGDEARGLGVTRAGLTGPAAFASEISSSMEGDMIRSCALTLIIVAVLFLLAHRRLQPQFWLIAMLGLTLYTTLAIGGVLYGSLSALSVGFAAILIGLSVDYGLIVYQESLYFTGSLKHLQRRVMPTVFWAAATTAAVFLGLNLSSFPSIGQLGTLVALGLIVGASAMLFLFARIVHTGPSPTLTSAPLPPRDDRPASRRMVLIPSALLVIACILILAYLGLPGMTSSSQIFYPKGSRAYAEFKILSSHIAQDEESSLFLVTAPTPDLLVKRLDKCESRLGQARAGGAIEGSQLPTALLPRREFQAANRTAVARLVRERERLRKEMDEAGFTGDAWTLAGEVFQYWEEWLAASPDAPISPRMGFARQITDQVISVKEGEAAALGRIARTRPENSTPNTLPTSFLSEVEGVYAVDWEALGPAVLNLAKRDVTRVFLPLGLILLGMLALIYRRWREVALSLALLACGALGTLACMRLAGIQWNYLNLTAIPLLLGTGLDYSIHILLALRRYDGDVRQVRRTVGKALMLCGITTATAFGSLGLAGNIGLSSLGIVCALGILANMLAAVFLLPGWWLAAHGPERRSP